MKGIGMNIYEKLSEARIRLQELNLKKSGRNRYAGFSYWELADFMPSVNKIFADLKLCSAFSVNCGEAALEIVNAEKPEERMVFSSPTAAVDLKGCTAIQGVGAIHTYMRRYLYVNALEIVESDQLDCIVGKPQSCEAPRRATLLAQDSCANKNSSRLVLQIESIDSVARLNGALHYFMEKEKEGLLIADEEDWRKKLNEKAKELNADFVPGEYGEAYKKIK